MFLKRVSASVSPVRAAGSPATTESLDGVLSTISPATATASVTAPPFPRDRDPDKVDPREMRDRIWEDWVRLETANKRKAQESDGVHARTQTGLVPASTSTTLAMSLAGNMAIASLKLVAWMQTGHSAMLSEAVHTLVDVGNQAILGIGLREAERSPDRHYQYGYGRSAFFYSLLSALSTFGFGALYTGYQGFYALLYPPVELVATSWTWGVLGVSFLVDGYVLQRAWRNVREQAALRNVSPLAWLLSFRDPFTVAVVFEDSAAVLGVALASSGIALAHVTGNVVWDAVATLCISGLLAGVSLKLVSLNRSFLLGRPLDPDITAGIRSMLLQRRSIDAVFSVQSQWVGPSAFAYNAEVDFDGTYLASRVYSEYEARFVAAAAAGTLQQDLVWLLPAFSEDITRVLEKEVRDIQHEVRKTYAEAAFVEIVPDSSQTTRSALKDMSKKSLRRMEHDLLQAMIQLNSTQSKNDSRAALFNLGSAYLAFGHYEKSLAPLLSCLQLQEQELGPDHPDVAVVMDRLGSGYAGMKQYAKAQPLLERAVVVLEAAVAAQSDARDDRTLLALAAALESLGVLCRDTQASDRALGLFERALKIRNDVQSPTDPQLAATLDLLATLYARIPSRRGVALEYLQRLLRTHEAQYGATDWRVGRVLERLGDLHAMLSQFDQALHAYRGSLAIIFHQDLNEMERANLLVKIGQLHLDRNEPLQCINLLEEALQLREKALPVGDPAVRHLKFKLVDLCHQLGIPLPPDRREEN